MKLPLVCSGVQKTEFANRLRLWQPIHSPIRLAERGTAHCRRRSDQRSTNVLKIVADDVKTQNSENHLSVSEKEGSGNYPLRQEKDWKDEDC